MQEHRNLQLQRNVDHGSHDLRQDPSCSFASGDAPVRTVTLIWLETLPLTFNACRFLVQQHLVDCCEAYGLHVTAYSSFGPQS